MIVLPQGTDYPRAERYLRKYLTQEPEPNSAPLAYAHWHLGQALEKEGKRAEAIAEIEQATKLKPDLEDAKKDLRRLRASRSNPAALLLNDDLAQPLRVAEQFVVVVHVRAVLRLLDCRLCPGLMKPTEFSS